MDYGVYYIDSSIIIKIIKQLKGANMLKKLSLIPILACTLNAGMFDSVMGVISSPEVQKAAADTVKASDFISDVSKKTNLDIKQTSKAVANILQYSQSNMTKPEQAKVSGSIPVWEQLASTGLSSITSSEALQNSFKTMGIEPSLIQTIAPLIIEFMQSQTGKETGQIISNSLSSLLK